MSINLKGMTAPTDGAMTPVGSQGYDPTPLRNRQNGASGRPYEESLAELSLQLAARFAQGASGTGIAAEDMHGMRGASRARYEFKKPISRRRTVALIFLFCMGAFITVTIPLYQSQRDLFHPSFFGRPAEATLSLAPFWAPALASKANVAKPSAPEAPKEPPAHPAAASEPTTVVPADSAPIPVAQDTVSSNALAPTTVVPADLAPIAVAQDAVSSNPDPALEAEEIRELQTLLRSLDLSPGPVDGMLGPRTAAASRRFQESRQLVSGNINREFLKRLREEVVPPISTPDVATLRLSPTPVGK